MNRAHRPAVLAASTVALAALGGACEADGLLPNREYTPDMVQAVPREAFARDPLAADGRVLRRPPPGTVPRGFEPLAFEPGPEEAARAGAELVNPLPASDLVLKRGAIAFARYCSPCHGADGLGDGLVATRFPRPPSLTAPHARALPDGRIFHIATYGQGLMPGHGSQISRDDRWRIVHAVRALQARGEGAR